MNGRDKSGDLRNLERAMGIEPTLSAWEAEVLPLNYARYLRVSRLAQIKAFNNPNPLTYFVFC